MWRSLREKKKENKREFEAKKKKKEIPMSNDKDWKGMKVQTRRNSKRY